MGIKLAFDGLMGFCAALPEIVGLIKRGVKAVENLYYESKRANAYKKAELAIEKAKHEGKTEDITDLYNSL